MIEFGDERLPPRFWDKVEVEDVTGCWVWIAYRNANGYGQFWSTELKADCLAHRYARHHLVGDVEVRSTDHGIDAIDHVVCENPPCVNPAHNEVAGQRANVLHGNSPPAINARKKHCAKCGGSYEYKLNGWRWCRPCNHAWHRANYKAKK